MIIKRIIWIAFALMAILIGLYPLIYFIIDRQFGLLSTKSTALLENDLWNVAFYGHITLGGIALLIGWLQFSDKIRKSYLSWHRRAGFIYMVSVLLSGICGIYIALYAAGGTVSALGFGTLGVIWIGFTIFSFKAVKGGNIAAHEKWMTYSYAACFAAVTLRIWLPILAGTIGNFMMAYQIVSWLCWVPNLVVAYWIISRKSNIENLSGLSK